MSRTSSRSTSAPSLARANSLFLALLLGALLGGCASVDGRGLVPGRSTLNDVERVMGRPADRRAGPQGEVVYWYPQLPYGHASYAARVAADGRLIAVEQRLTEDNIKKVVKGTSAGEVRDLLGPPWQPTVFSRLEREIWTYPMLVQGYGYPKWFVVQLSLDSHEVREAFLMDDPQYVPKDSGIRRP